MDIIKTYTHPTKVILHFIEDELRATQSGARLPLYQAVMPAWDDVSAYSPCKEYVRFNFSSENGEPVNEINGWIQVNSIVVDCELEELIEDEWRLVANG